MATQLTPQQALLFEYIKLTTRRIDYELDEIRRFTDAVIKGEGELICEEMSGIEGNDNRHFWIKETLVDKDGYQSSNIPDDTCIDECRRKEWVNHSELMVDAATTLNEFQSKTST